MRKNNYLSALLTFFLVSSCSHYKLGHVMHPQIKTVGIGQVINQTDQPRLSVFMVEKLKERFMQDASLKVVPTSEADIILTGKITNYNINARGRSHQEERENGQGFFSLIFSTSVTFTYEVKTKKDWELLKGSVTDKADFTELIDQYEERKNAFRRASYEVAKKVVSEITEAW